MNGMVARALLGDPPRAHENQKVGLRPRSPTRSC